MFDPNIFSDLAKKMTDALPQNLQIMKQDMEKQFKSVLQTTFNKLDLVTREEFDAQNEVLAHTRQMVEELEKRVSAVESKCGIAPPNNATAEIKANMNPQDSQ